MCIRDSKYTDVKLAVKNDPIQFHTPLLDLKSVNIYWIKEDASNEIVLHADLDFNATVNAEELKKFLKISQSKEEKTINFVTTQNAKTISVAVHNICLLYTSDAADERSSVDLGGRRIIKKKKRNKHRAANITSKKQLRRTKAK